MNRCEQDEVNYKCNTDLVIKKINDELKLELSAEVDRRRVETDVEIRNKLHESNELIRCKRSKSKQKNDTALVSKKQSNNEM